MLIRISALATAGNGLCMRLSERGGGSGSSLLAVTGEKTEGSLLSLPKELPYSLSKALTMSCRDEGAMSPKPCWVM